MISKSISDISQGYHNQLRHIDGLKYTTVVQKQRLIMLRRYSDTASTVMYNYKKSSLFTITWQNSHTPSQAELYSASFEKATILNDCYSQTCILNRS